MQTHPNKPTINVARRSDNANHALRRRRLGHDERPGSAIADGPAKDDEKHHEQTGACKVPIDGRLCTVGARCNPKGGSANVPTQCGGLGEEAKRPAMGLGRQSRNPYRQEVVTRSHRLGPARPTEKRTTKTEMARCRQRFCDYEERQQSAKSRQGEFRKK